MRAWTGLDGLSSCSDSADNRWYAYVEGQRGGQLIAAAKEVSVLHMRYARMRTQAPSLDDSLSLLRRIRGTG